MVKGFVDKDVQFYPTAQKTRLETDADSPCNYVSGCCRCIGRDLRGDIHRTNPVGREEKATKTPDPAAVERVRRSEKSSTICTRRPWSASPRIMWKSNRTRRQRPSPRSFSSDAQEGLPHGSRTPDATGKPKSKKNVAQTDFEKKVVADIKGGKTYVEEIAEHDGKPVLRAGTIVPAVMSQCCVCHKSKKGNCWA